MSDFFEDQENMNEDDDIITLYNEERDVDEDFYHLATLDVDDKWYVVMKPVEKLPDIEEQRHFRRNRKRRGIAEGFRRIRQGNGEIRPRRRGRGITPSAPRGGAFRQGREFS